MDDLESIFTIDRCGNNKKIKDVSESRKENKKNSSEKTNILYECNSKLLELKSDNIKPQIHKHIPKQFNKRIHEVAKEEQQIVPGKLSENLRNALGLSKYGIPSHIYKMRYLGYPPGWLKKIETRPSDLKFIGDDSKLNSQNSIVYRTEELIEYPGFNTLLNYDPEEDHWQELGMIPMKKEQSLEEYSKYLKSKQNKNNLCINTTATSDVTMETLELQRQSILAQINDIDECRPCK